VVGGATPYSFVQAEVGGWARSIAALRVQLRWTQFRIVLGFHSLSSCYWIRCGFNRCSQVSLGQGINIVLLFDFSQDILQFPRPIREWLEIVVLEETHS
jgi:hypothetical protein